MGNITENEKVAAVAGTDNPINRVVHMNHPDYYKALGNCWKAHTHVDLTMVQVSYIWCLKGEWTDLGIK